MSIFVVLSSYYKHGEATNKIFTDVGNLEYFLLEQIESYDKSFTLDDIADDEYDVENEEEMIYALIKTAVRMGKEQVSEQIGCGIIEITEIILGKDIDIDKDTEIYLFD